MGETTDRLHGSLLLGIDGGGSKTAVLVATRDGTVVGRGNAGASNYQSVGLENALDALNRAVDQACADAGADLSRIRAAGLGLAGVDRAEDRAIFEHWLVERMPGVRATIVNDAFLVLAAGTPDDWGIALICGTGTICIGRNRAGEEARVDGWGHVLGDDGSGYDIGRRALRATMQAVDGRGPATALLPHILAFWELEHAEELIARVYRQQATTTEIAALARVVAAAAAAGDATASTLLEGAGQALAHTVTTLARRLAFDGEIPCALAGGVITRSDRVRRAFLAAANHGVMLEPVTRVLEPVVGAVRLAQRIVGSP